MTDPNRIHAVPAVARGVFAQPTRIHAGRIVDADPELSSLYVGGNLKLEGRLETKDDKDVLATVKRLEERIATLETKINERLDRMDEAINKLWNAPGMPGFIEAEQSFQTELASYESLGEFQKHHSHDSYHDDKLLVSN